MSKPVLHNPDPQCQMQNALYNNKNNMQQQYAFIIPIARGAAKFSKDDTASGRQNGS
jgi:hypothetical protein